MDYFNLCKRYYLCHNFYDYEQMTSVLINCTYAYKVGYIKQFEYDLLVDMIVRDFKNNEWMFYALEDLQ